MTSPLHSKPRPFLPPKTRSKVPYLISFRAREKYALCSPRSTYGLSRRHKLIFLSPREMRYLPCLMTTWIPLHLTRRNFLPHRFAPLPPRKSVKLVGYIWGTVSPEGARSVSFNLGKSLIHERIFHGRSPLNSHKLRYFGAYHSLFLEENSLLPGCSFY